MLRRIISRSFSFRESRTALHIRPPSSKNSLNEKMSKYSPETMMLDKKIGTKHLMTDGLLEQLDDRRPENWLNLTITHESQGIPLTFRTPSQPKFDGNRN